MNPVCPQKVICECDESPVSNLSVERDDPLTYPSLGYSQPPADIRFFFKQGCLGMCFSLISQEDADLCAQTQADQCAGMSFLNAAQTCVQDCPDGTQSTFTVSAGLFAGYTQVEADTKGYNWACNAAKLFCLPPGLRFQNTAQTCESPCADGTTQSWTIPSGLYTRSSQTDADNTAHDEACVLAQMQCLPAIPRFWNAEQRCQVLCPDGHTSSYVVIANTFFGRTQLEADSLASTFACNMATLACVQPLVPNAAQTCTVPCGHLTASATVPAGVVFAADQVSADALAYQSACRQAALNCAGGGGGGTSPGASCTVYCPDGSPFNYTLPPGVYFGSYPDAYCRYLATQHMVCLSALQGSFCVGSASFEFITATGNFVGFQGGYNYFELTGGSLPPGWTFNGGFTPDAYCTITGTPTTPGTYAFTIRVTTPTGEWMAKTYTTVVTAITTTSPLPAGSVNVAYSQQLVSDGYVMPAFSISSGTLPDGLTLSVSGLISGTPTTGGTSQFTICVEETGP